MGKNQSLFFLVVLGLAVLVPLAGHWARRHGAVVCAVDGRQIDPAYRVRIRDPQDRSFHFCCIPCAEHWLRGQTNKLQELYVTDEATGQEIPAPSAHFVRSLIYTMKANQSRVHAFKTQADAEHHARVFSGTILADDEKPFADHLN